MKKITLQLNNKSVVFDNINHCIITHNLLIWETRESGLLVKHSVCLDDLFSFVIVEDDYNLYNCKIQFCDFKNYEYDFLFKIKFNSREFQFFMRDDFNNEYSDIFLLSELKQIYF